MLKRIIYKLFIEQSTLQGVVAHLPHGLFTVFAAVEVHWVLALLFGIGFMFYEFLHEWRLKDKSYDDMAGWLIGVVIGSIIYRIIYWII